MKRRVEQVVVVGADAPAWMAAAAIQASLAGTGVRVRVIEVPSLLDPVDCYAALPTLAAFHRRLGLDEGLLFSLCNALPMSGQRFSNWSGSGPPFIHGYDSPSPAGAGVRFVHLWIKGRRKGLRTEFENFSLGAMAAKAGRVPVQSDDAELSAFFGYNIDARAYSALLRQFAISGGAEAKAAVVSEVETEGDRISAVLLADGERIEADLFVDASGPPAVLLSRLPNAEFESWSECLPCDRILSASAKALQPHPGFRQISAFRQGWLGLFPLQDRTAVVAAYDSREISDGALVGRLPILAGLHITGEAVVTSLSPGIRERTWVGNCVAVGESASSLEPLDAVQLHIAQYCISQLITLFPTEAGTFPEAELYDATIRRAAINLCDWQTAHYQLNRRFDEPLWDVCRDTAAPETLQRKIEAFSARGRIPVYDDETFEEESWESLFVGHGLVPQSYDPRVDAVPEQEHIASLHKRMEDIANSVGAMPTVDEYVSGALAHGPLETARIG